MSGHAAARATDLVEVTRGLVRVRSVSGEERELADLVEHRLRGRAPWLHVHRVGNSVVARTRRGSATRIVFAGHLDTVPGAVPTGQERAGDEVRGLGAVDMKGGLAVLLLLAELTPHCAADLTFVFYDKEETGSNGSGMKTLFEQWPELVRGDAAIVLEPTGGVIEAGCQGNLVMEFGFLGQRAHTARPWRGRNAIHRAVPSIARLAGFAPAEVELDGLRFRQSFSLVGIDGGVQGNVVPDRCTVRVNYRHAPTLDSATAAATVGDLVPDADDTHVRLSSPPAPPNLRHPVFERLRADGRLAVRPKLGWTDVGRFAEHGIPAINFGPGDAGLAHTGDESVHREELEHCLTVLSRLVESVGDVRSPRHEGKPVP